MFYADKNLLQVLAQCIMGGFFIFQGGKNLLLPGMVLGRFQSYQFPAPRLCLYAGVCMMWTGGTLLVLDFHTRVGAVILFIFTLLATAIFQRWWTVEDPVRRPYNFLMFFYNVFIMGALLLLM